MSLYASDIIFKSGDSFKASMDFFAGFFEVAGPYGDQVAQFEQCADTSVHEMADLYAVTDDMTDWEGWKYMVGTWYPQAYEAVSEEGCIDLIKMNK